MLGYLPTKFDRMVFECGGADYRNRDKEEHIPFY